MQCFTEVAHEDGELIDCKHRLTDELKGMKCRSERVMRLEGWAVTAKQSCWSRAG